MKSFKKTKDWDERCYRRIIVTVVFRFNEKFNFESKNYRGLQFKIQVAPCNKHTPFPL
jgi:hypothetical protein